MDFLRSNTERKDERAQGLKEGPSQKKKKPARNEESRTEIRLNKSIIPDKVKLGPGLDWGVLEHKPGTRV